MNPGIKQTGIHLSSRKTQAVKETALCFCDAIVVCTEYICVTQEVLQRLGANFQS